METRSGGIRWLLGRRPISITESRYTRDQILRRVTGTVDADRALNYLGGDDWLGGLVLPWPDDESDWADFRRCHVEARCDTRSLHLWLGPRIGPSSPDTQPSLEVMFAPTVYGTGTRVRVRYRSSALGTAVMLMFAIIGVVPLVISVAWYAMAPFPLTAVHLLFGLVVPAFGIGALAVMRNFEANQFAVLRTFMARAAGIELRSGERP